MKRFSLLVSILVIASLALAACGTGNTNNNVPDIVTGTDAGPGDTGAAVPTVTIDSMDLATATVGAIQPTTAATMAPTADMEATTVPTAGMEATTVPNTTDGTPDPQGVVTPLATPYRLSNVLDTDVRTMNGEDLGEIERLVVNSDGSIRYAILKTGEFLGMGGKAIFVPWQLFQPVAVDNSGVMDAEMVMNTTEEVLQGSPEVNMENLDFTTQNWDEDVMAYWSGQTPSVPVTGADVTDNQAVVFNSNFDDIDVVNSQDEELGELEDFIIDPTTGQIQYGVFEMGGYLGTGESYLPIPWASLNWVQNDDDGENQVLFNVDQEQLSTAPAFESWDNVDLTSDQFDADWNTFWQGVDNTVENTVDDMVDTPVPTTAP